MLVEVTMDVGICLPQWVSHTFMMRYLAADDPITAAILRSQLAVEFRSDRERDEAEEEDSESISPSARDGVKPSAHSYTAGRVRDLAGNTRSRELTPNR